MQLCMGEESGCSPAPGMSLSTRGQRCAEHVCASLSLGTCHVEGWRTQNSQLHHKNINHL